MSENVIHVIHVIQDINLMQVIQLMLVINVMQVMQVKDGWRGAGGGGVGVKGRLDFFRKFICFGSLTRPLGALTSLNFKLSASNVTN